MTIRLSNLPENPGVYIFRDHSSSVIYVGKAKNLKKRISSYFTTSSLNSWKISSLRISVEKVDYIICAGEREALVLERELIKKYSPFFNTIWKDNKEYPLIKITREPFPRLIFVRRKENDRALYFGPYPKASIVKKTIARLQRYGLIQLRRCSWDFSPQKPLEEKKRISCLYYHTGQCPSPCDFKKISRSEYLKLVTRTVRILRGDYENVLKNLRKEMKEMSDKMEYEKAASLRDCIKALSHMAEEVSLNERTAEELLNRENPFIELKETLGLKRVPLHIEVFDISTLFGRYAVASSVCFNRGEKNTAHYRHYKIKFKPENRGGDDFKMMLEAVSRRLKQIKEKGELPPDLLVIDGGKGQLKMATSALIDSKLDIEIISLAKRFEEIYSPGRGEPLRLPPTSPAILSLRKMRDEAHRFAISYHRKIRDKDFYEKEKKQIN